MADVDEKPVVRKVERAREWMHGDLPEGKSCSRKDRPVFTKPGEIPAPCGTTKEGWDYRGCGSEEWRSKGIVIRDQDKRVLQREKSPN